MIVTQKMAPHESVRCSRRNDRVVRLVVPPESWLNGDVRSRNVTGFTPPYDRAYDSHRESLGARRRWSDRSGSHRGVPVVPYGRRDCPSVGDCNYVGWGPRTLTLIITGIIVLRLLTAAIVDSTKDR